MINWKVRLTNETFWLTIVPALGLLVMTIAEVFGYTIDLTTIIGKIQAVIKAVFAVLGIIGIVVDPTTDGVGDSQRAMTYVKPWKDEADE